MAASIDEVNSKTEKNNTGSELRKGKNIVLNLEGQEVAAAAPIPKRNDIYYSSSSFQYTVEEIIASCHWEELRREAILTVVRVLERFILGAGISSCQLPLLSELQRLSLHLI
ncbi:hypothetical protein P8452_16602 [Trifolium repens]|nr:hypothetical protein P8452_16602 [Trifolium repens]